MHPAPGHQENYLLRSYSTLYTGNHFQSPRSHEQFAAKIVKFDTTNPATSAGEADQKIIKTASDGDDQAAGTNSSDGRSELSATSQRRG